MHQQHATKEVQVFGDSAIFNLSVGRPSPVRNAKDFRTALSHPHAAIMPHGTVGLGHAVPSVHETDWGALHQEF
jgi:hypothetical protein